MYYPREISAQNKINVLHTHWFYSEYAGFFNVH